MDKKAKNILFRTYWTSDGWIMDESRKIDPADFQYAKEKGVMFDPLSISREQLFSQLRETVDSIPLTKITDAFLNGLINKRLDWRSGLGSYANAKTILEFPEKYDSFLDFGENMDLNVLNFERIKWGGVRHFSALYNWLDLELLNKEIIPPAPQQSIDLFRSILKIIENSQRDDTPGRLRDNLKGAFNTSKNERHTLMEILGAANIIRPLRFDRKEPGKHDWRFVLHWRGEDGYDKGTVELLFGQYSISNKLPNRPDYLRPV